MIEKYLMDAVIPIPKFNDSRLTGFDRLNENVLNAMLTGLPKEKQTEIVSMSIEDIEKCQSMAGHIKQCYEIKQEEFVWFESREEFWRQIKLYIEKRKSYLSKLMYGNDLMNSF